MAKVRYKEPSSGMKKMVVSKLEDSRPSLGLTEVKGEIYYFNIDLLIPYHNQARKKFSDQALQDLANSIKEQGILQPLLVIKSTEFENKFEVVSGERRLRAAKIAGVDKVPCKILDKDSDSDYIAIIENIQREDLHPIELGNAYAELSRVHSDLTQEEIANKIGITRQKYQDYLQISSLPEDVKNHLIQSNVNNVEKLRSLSRIKSVDELRTAVFGPAQKKREKKVIFKMYFDGESFSLGGAAFKSLSSQEKAALKDHLTQFMTNLD